MVPGETATAGITAETTESETVGASLRLVLTVTVAPRHQRLTGSRLDDQIEFLAGLDRLDRGAQAVIGANWLRKNGVLPGPVDQSDGLGGDISLAVDFVI
jgi:hypothetical protein